MTCVSILRATACDGRHIYVRYFPGPRTGDRLRITIGTDAEMDTFLSAVATLDKA